MPPTECIYQVWNWYLKACWRKVRKTRTDGRTDGQTDGRTDGQTDRRTLPRHNTFRFSNGRIKIDLGNARSRSSSWSKLLATIGAKCTTDMLNFNFVATWSFCLTYSKFHIRPWKFIIFYAGLLHWRWGNIHHHLGAVSIRKTVLPGMAIPMLKIRRPNGRLIFNMEIAIRR